MADIITKTFPQFISEQIERKYMMMSYNSFNIPQVIDSYCPYIILDITRDSEAGQVYHSTINNDGQEKYIEFFKTKDFAISEAFANRFGIRKVPIETLVKVLGFNKEMISTLFNETAKKKLDIVFVGFGGTGVNTFHWLSELASWCDMQEIFVNGVVMDADTIDFTNILRFPMDMNKYHQRSTSLKSGIIEVMYKTNLATNYAGLFKRLIKLNNRLSSSSSQDVLYDLGINKSRKNLNKVSAEQNTIFYGAPDIPTRDMLSDVRFIAATHGDNECSLHIRPKVDTQLQQESYGMIQLNVFFMNQLRMAIGLLEILAREDFSKIIDEQDNEILKFDFFKYFSKHGSKIMDDTGLMFNMRNTTNRQG